MNYLDFLSKTHDITKAQNYLEIGVRNGHSLSLANHHAVGVDPALKIKKELNPSVELLQMKSDDYFHQLAPHIKYDMIFVDGMHLFEYALRDVCNASKHLNNGGLIFMDDILPKNQEMALREHQRKAWTGDVWKVIKVIEERVPDVNFLLIDTQPTGLGMFYGEGCKRLAGLLENHDELVELYANNNHKVPDDVISRKKAVPAEQVLTFIQDILAN